MLIDLIGIKLHPKYFVLHRILKVNLLLENIEGKFLNTVFVLKIFFLFFKIFNVDVNARKSLNKITNYSSIQRHEHGAQQHRIPSSSSSSQ